MATYTDFTDVPERHQKILHEMLSGGEEFITAATFGRSILKRTSPLHVLTTKRLLEIQKVLWSEQISDIRLSQISRVQFRSHTTGNLGEIEIEGSGFDESFKLMNDDGRRFSDTIRAQLGEQKEVA